MDKIFIEQAKHIRRQYIKNSKEILKCEERIEESKHNLMNISNIDISEFDENELKEKLILIEKNIRNIEMILKPHTDRMIFLEKEADKLFENIKQRHPDLTVENIKNELIPHLKEVKY
jgi:hypothetical protein